MLSLTLSPPSRRGTYDTRPTARGRALGIGLTLLAELLFLLLLVALNPSVLPQPDDAPSTTLIDIAPEAGPKLSKPEPRENAKAVSPARAKPRITALRIPTPPSPSSFIPMSSADMAAADISKLGSAASGATTAKGTGAVQGPGEGPGGAHLYYARWVREPTRAEIAGYATKDAPAGSWGEIACKTIERNRVEDCRQLGESPGSGLARTMRLAAWQFLVRPPNIDGKPLIGSWVRIRYDIVAADSGK